MNKNSTSLDYNKTNLQSASHSSSQVRVIKEQRYYKRPDIHIDEEIISKLIRAGIDPCVARIDLELIKLELQAESNWSEIRCEIAELEYKRLLTLILWNKNLHHPIVPTKLVDEIWHKHILDTRAYHADMEKVFGEYLHHFPFLGFLSKESKKLKEEAFLLSCELYERTFGEPFTYSAKKLSTKGK